MKVPPPATELMAPPPAAAKKNKVISSKVIELNQILIALTAITWQKRLVLELYIVCSAIILTAQVQP